MPNEAVTAHALHMSTDAMIVVVPVLAACLRLRAGSFLGGKKKRARGTIGAWVAFGTRPTVPVARAAHAPDLQTKRVSRCSSGQESS